MGNATRQMKRRREQERKTQPQKKWSSAQKKKVGIICACVALVLLLFLMFWTPAGTVKTWFGKPMFVASNAVLAKGDPYYYNLGTYTLPEGYVRDTEYRLSSDPYRFEVKASPSDQTVLDYFYLAPVVSPDIERIQSSFANMYENCSDIQTMDVSGVSAQWFDVSYPSNNTDTSAFIRNICIYIPAKHDCSVLVSLYSPKVPEAELPTGDALLAYLDEIVSGLKLQ